MVNAFLLTYGTNLQDYKVIGASVPQNSLLGINYENKVKVHISEELLISNYIF